MTPALLLCAAVSPGLGGGPGPRPRPDLPKPLFTAALGPDADAGPFGRELFRPQSPQDFPTATLTGLLQFDSVRFAQQDDSVAAVGDIEDGTAIRRTRLGGFGRAWEGVDYYVEVDFGLQGGTAIADAFMTLTDAVPGHDVRFGFIRQPVGMASRTGARVLPLLERPLPFALQPFRQIGVNINGFDEEWGLSWEGAVFRFPSDSDGGVLGDRGGWSPAARLSALLLEDGPSDTVLHAGMSAALLSPADDLIRYFSRPETFSPESRGIVATTGVRAIPPFVDTTPLAAERSHTFGLELAGRRGPAWFQAEYNAAALDPAEKSLSAEDATGPGGVLAPRSNAVFHGVHLTAGLFLTGEVKPYDLPTATFGRVDPDRDFSPKNGRWGAVEVLGRVSHLDLTDRADDFEGVFGGELTDLTVGLNWYLNPRAKFQLNYIRALLDDRLTGGAPGGRSDTDVFAVRAQVDF